MAKMGRPPVDNPKASSFGFRMTDREKERIRLYADSHGMTMTEVVIAAVNFFIENAADRGAGSLPP